METNGMSGGMLPGMPSGLLGLEMPLQHPQQQPQQHHQHPHHQQHHHQIVSFSAAPVHDGEHHSQQSQVAPPKHPYPFAAKGKLQQQQQNLAFSDEDEPGFAEEGGEATSDGRGKRVSPWQRMKWTDNMVKLLIMVVFFVGDECGPESSDPNKKKTGLLQKKGKWKSVSRAMMEKGFCVSPQQCEDKFNDLNKRYKRVNDILGKGTACRVVENQSLLETMDHLSPKMKEEVRKLLNSKHLFFREMCAYHSSGGGGAPQSCEVDSSSQLQHQQQLQQNQRCFHLPESEVGNRAERSSKGEDEEEEEGIERDEGDEEEDDDDEDDDDNDEEDEETAVCEGDGHKDQQQQGGGEEEGNKKRQRRGLWSEQQEQQQQQQELRSELARVMQDGNRSVWEQRQWMKKRWMELEEQRVSYQLQGFELEKQRFKWQKFSGKKERELERMKLENERMKLENERMVLMLRQKEAELDLKWSESSITG